MDQQCKRTLSPPEFRDQIRTKCGPKKHRNIVQALTSRQLDPSSRYDSHNQDHIRNFQSANFANRMHSFTNPVNLTVKVLSQSIKFSNPFKRHFMFQPDYQTGGPTLDSVVPTSPWEYHRIVLIPRVRESDQNNRQPTLQFDLDWMKFGPRLNAPLEHQTGHVFVDQNAFRDIKFKNTVKSTIYNVPVFFKHISGIVLHQPTRLLLHSTMYCQRESDNRLRNGSLHHQITFDKAHNLDYEPFFRDGSANRPFEDYYTVIHNFTYYKWQRDYYDYDQNICDCEDCMSLSAQTNTIEQPIPVESYCAIHWHLIRTFYCEKYVTKYVPLLNNVSLESYDIRYYEPGYHRYPIPNASICGYSNGNIRLGSYDRRCNPMQREINIHDQSIRAVKFHPKNDLQFLVSGDGNFLRLYDVRMLAQDVPAPVLDYHQHRSTHHYHQFVLDPTTNLLVSSGCDNMVRFWNSSTGKLERCFDPRYNARPEVELPVQAFYSGDFRYDNCLPRSEALFTSYGGEYRMFPSKIYDSE